jgi:hypothetical protein
MALILLEKNLLSPDNPAVSMAGRLGAIFP